MAVLEAPISRYKKNNHLIYIVLLAGLAIWFTYDGYFNAEFIEKHTVDELPDSTLKFNMYAPFVMIAVAAALTIRLMLIRGKKVVADETAVHMNGITIRYDQIQSIDKTHFDKQGYFEVMYKENGSQERTVKFSDRQYDHLGLVLDHLVSKIS